MAKLVPYTGDPIPHWQVGETDIYLEAERIFLDNLFQRSLALKDGEVVGGVLTFPRGDGKAIYLVVSDNPLSIAHIAVGDAWTVELPLIRGLHRQDALRMLHAQRELHRIFSKPQQKETAELTGGEELGRP